MNRSMSFSSARAVVAVVLAVGSLGLLASACGGRDANDPSTQPQYNAYGQQPGQYPQQPGQYPQQPGQYQQQPGQYPQQPGQYQQQPGTTAPGTTTTAAPSPLALPCTTPDDMICGTHKCNVQAGRCALPCAAATDCKAGFTCMGAICAPAMPQ